MDKEGEGLEGKRDGLGRTGEEKQMNNERRHGGWVTENGERGLNEG